MALAGTVVLGLLVFVLPGFVVTWIAGARVPAAVAASIPATFGLVGLSAWMWGGVGARFGWLTLSITLLLAVAAAGLWRWAFARRARRRGPAAGGRRCGRGTGAPPASSTPRGCSRPRAWCSAPGCSSGTG
ncbi:DUF6541 family protein [Corynebacterium timonense]|uniref:DUF6541 family protein n=1 Tax=Corynebacterium timonense TaxID=441500 RepID=UPI002F90E1D4